MRDSPILCASRKRILSLIQQREKKGNGERVSLVLILSSSLSQTSSERLDSPEPQESLEWDSDLAPFDILRRVALWRAQEERGDRKEER